MTIEVIGIRELKSMKAAKIERELTARKLFRLDALETQRAAKVEP